MWSRLTNAQASGVPAKPEVSQCDNCDDFPAALLEVDDSELLDLASLPPERRLDFLVGEWELDDRWQMTWLTVSVAAVFTGGLETRGVIAFYESQFTGDRRKLRLEEGMRYVLRNITRDTFIAEEYRSADGGETFDILKWRLLYRRRADS